MFPEFIYESFNYDVQPDGLHISFCFRLMPKEGDTADSDRFLFRPTAFIPSRSFLHPEKLTKQTLDSLVFRIGMIELISYWKCYCPPLVRIKPFHLTDSDICFWKEVYFNGLGEFFYINGLNASIEDFMTIVSEDDMNDVPPKCDGLFWNKGNVDNSHIVPIGGGKDSVVTLEVLGGGKDTIGNDMSQRPLPLIMNPRGATIDCVRRAGYELDDVIVIKRTIDPLLLEFNKQGALNGHTPFSAMLAFYSLLASALTGNRNRIALSNESSANESTVAGTSVNHQYSKTLEFENHFRRYVSLYLSNDFNYYSFLRPLTELQIAMLFSRYEHYHDVFKSCNAGSKEDIWCGKCAKCLFAYIILSPFIEPTHLNAVFGKNMLDDESLRLEFDQLTGKAETKPFECVGTVSEVNDALSMTISKWYSNTDKLPALLAGYKVHPIMNNLYSFQTEHNLCDDDFHMLSNALRAPVQVETMIGYKGLFNFFVGREVLIAGYGREGKSTHNLLQRMFPTRCFDIASNNDEIDAALHKKHYDIIMKSPGIPTSFFDGKCDLDTLSSQTDLFLSYSDVSIIGVTGTKGKSTTANLIYHVLNHSGFDTVMAGNMGIPLFDIFDQLNPNKIVVVEFSCHQLENIHKAPETAVLLNLFPEHLDHYRDYNDYQNAKMQIALKQKIGDHFIYCSDNADLSAKVAEYKDCIKSDIIAYNLVDAKKAIFITDANCGLKGDHNLLDIYAAWLAVSCYSVDPKKEFVEALETFSPLEHRLEKVATVNDVTYYNDSISTIPQTAIAALEALKEVDTLILGGFNRGVDYTPLTEYLMNEPLGKMVRNIVLFGSAGEEMAKGLRERNIMCHFSSDYSMEEAVKFAAKNTAKNKICLLSPAASSYDHYKNFEYRGRDFKEEVDKLKEEI